MEEIKTGEFILLIMNCEKYKWKAQKQRERWLKTLPPFLSYFHVLGDPKLANDKDFIIDYKNNLLTVKTEDDYNSLPKKVIASFQAISQSFPNLKYIFKTDDDQMLTNENFFKTIINILFSKQPKVHYAGFPVQIHNKHTSAYHLIHSELPPNIELKPTIYCNGRLYLLSKEAIENVVKKRKEIEKEYFEDYAIGYNLDSIFKENLLSIDNNKFFQDMK